MPSGRRARLGDVAVCPVHDTVSGRPAATIRLAEALAHHEAGRRDAGLAR